VTRPAAAPAVFLDGAFVAADAARLAPDDRGFLFGDGVYEVARAVDGRFFALDAHLARLERGARALAIPLPPGGAAAVAAVWEELLDRNGLRSGEAVAYCQVTRGAGRAPTSSRRPARRPRCTPTRSASPRPTRCAPTGASCVSYPDLRWARCDLKTVNLLPNVLAAAGRRGRGAFEAVLVPRGRRRGRRRRAAVGPRRPAPRRRRRGHRGVAVDGVRGDRRRAAARTRRAPASCPASRAPWCSASPRRLGVPVRERRARSASCARRGGVRGQHHGRRDAGGGARRAAGGRRPPGAGGCRPRRRARRGG
jgi:hypothetical protein